MSYRITPEDIDRAETAGACREAIEWLRASPRTVAELLDYNRSWALWARTTLAEMPDTAVEELRAAGCGRAWWDDEGRLHRDDGPAVEYAFGSREWWRHGRYLGIVLTDGTRRGPHLDEIPEDPIE